MGGRMVFFGYKHQNPNPEVNHANEPFSIMQQAVRRNPLELNMPPAARNTRAVWFVALLCSSGAIAQRPVPLAQNPYAEYGDADWRRWEEQRAQTGRADGWPPPWLDATIAAISTLREKGHLTKNLEIPHASASKALSDQLFRDWKDPWANSHWQNAILSMTSASKFGTEEARQIYADGLLEYYHGGGGLASAGNLLDLSSALHNVAGSNNSDLTGLSDELLYEALIWSTQVGASTVASEAGKELTRRQTPPADVQVEPSAPETAASPELAPEQPVSAQPKNDALARFRASVKTLGQKSRPVAEDVAQVGALAKSLLSDEAHAARDRELAVATYLHTLSVFVRRFKDSLPELTAEVEKQLVDFPSATVLARNTQLRSAWVRCASTLGNKSSERLRAHVQTLVKGADSPRARSAFDAARKSLQPAGS